MRILLITQIYCIVLGMPYFSIRGRISECFILCLAAQHVTGAVAETTRGVDLHCTMLPKTSARGKLIAASTSLGLGSSHLHREHLHPKAQNKIRSLACSHRSVGRFGFCRRFVASDSLISLQADQSPRQGPPYTFPKFDEYGDLSFAKEKERLDYFAEELKSVPGEPGYIIEYRTKGKRQKRLARAKRAKDYLVKVKSIDAKRILIVNGGYQKEFKIELRLGPVSPK